MNKYTALKTLNTNGDSTITLNREDPIVATVDFSTPYIKIKKARSPRLNIDKNSILVWSWSDDKLRAISVAAIKNIKPLSEVLRNVREDGEETKSW